MIFKNMFQAKTALMAVAMVLFAGSFTACSDDDDNEGGGSSTLGTPEYADVSAKYEITSGGDIASIELTESGNYVVIMSNYSAPEYDEYMALAPVAPVTRSGSGVISGKYVKISDTEFILEGFGSVVIEGDTDNAFSLQISKTGEEPYTLSAEKNEVEFNDELSQTFCRTWNINKINLRVQVDGFGVIYNKTVAASQYKQLIEGLLIKMEQLESQYGDDEEDEYEDEENGDEEYLDLIKNPEQIIVTRAASYMVTYEGGELGISTWTWTDRSAGVFRYSWDYDSLLDPYASNECIVKFDGTSMTLYENKSDEDGEMTAYQTYYCSEAQ